MREIILIAGASNGSGHMKAASNIAKALSLIRADWHIEIINVFDYLPPGLRILFNQGWRFASCHLDRLYSEFYRRSLNRSNSRQIIHKVIQTTAQRLANKFEGQRPVVYIATHSIAASIGSVLKERFQCKLCIVTTDFVLHPIHLSPNVDFFYVPPRFEMIPSRSELKIDNNKTVYTGIPIARDFAIEKDREALQRGFGLSKNLATVLVSFGGDGLKAGRHIQLFNALLDVGLPLQFIVLAGRNAQFAKAMRERYGTGKYRHQIKIYDYLDNVSDLYAVADIFLGKAGGVSISEALAVGLPIVFVDRLPGQEEFNVNLITSLGLGCYVHNVDELASFIGSYLKNINLTSKKKIHEIARPLSSESVAKSVVSLVR